MANLYVILARTPFPGPDAPTGNVPRVAVTFRFVDDVTPHTIWIPAEIATDDAIAATIEKWTENHPNA